MNEDERSKLSLNQELPPYPFNEQDQAQLLADPVPATSNDLDICRHSWSKPYYPVSAYVVAVLCFPIGVLCCVRMKERKCIKCGLETDETYVERRGDDNAYRLGFAIGAIETTLQHHS
ncbi:hypothetical protein BC830DRAFT_1120595 [Chytriomyces sp. MP71]|nr:hypothetical protein BC830DRAFT_1120595 [Chytriomyces sp. MP71]